jgi:Bacteriophage tail sheath protein
LQPQLVTNWEEFVRNYGGFVDRIPGGTAFKYLPYAVRGFFENGGQRLYIARVTPPGSTSAHSNQGRGAMVVEAIGPGSWGRNILLRVRPATLAKPATVTAGWFRLTVLYFPDGIPHPFVDPTDPMSVRDPNRRDAGASEEYDNVSALSTDSNFAETAVNGHSKLVKLTMKSRPPNVEFPNAVLDQGGDPGHGEPGLGQFRGDPNAPAGQRTALLSLAGIADISLIAIPDEVVLPAVRSDLLKQCEILKDRFAILSASDAEQMGNISSLRPPQDSTYGAFYLPWVVVPASHTEEKQLLVPPTGHVAGIFARVDAQRGVHRAPANEPVRGIVTKDVSKEYKPLRYILNDDQQNVLGPKGINVIRAFGPEHTDIRVWGSRTMSPDSIWTYINVRRLIIFIEKSIDSGTQWTVFEPNDERTWKALRDSIIGFLRTLWMNGALMGTKDEEAFFVKCDRTTMTQDDINNGRLNCLVGVATVKPAEFVIFRISRKTAEGAT